MEAFLKFFAVIFPTLLDLARDLFVSHQGDADQASVEISDLRDTVTANRKRRDEELQKKYKG
jgi:hypothetical protein